MIDGRPHWEDSFPEELWPSFEEFRNFLAIVWHHLGLPAPTEAQYEPTDYSTVMTRQRQKS